MAVKDPFQLWGFCDSLILIPLLLSPPWMMASTVALLILMPLTLFLWSPGCLQRDLACLHHLAFILVWPVTTATSHTGSSRLRTVSTWFLMSRERHSTTSLGNLCQFSVNYSVKKCFLTFRRNPLCFSLCPLSLVLLLGTTENSVPLNSLHPEDSKGQQASCCFQMACIHFNYFVGNQYDIEYSYLWIYLYLTVVSSFYDLGNVHSVKSAWSKNLFD